MADCELTFVERRSIDVRRARHQHAAYRRALEAAGLELLVLEADDRFADCPFVEDIALDLGDGLRILCNPGAPSRRGERDAVRAALEGLGPLVEMPESLMLDGGDVLAIRDRLYVGRSTRTDDAALRWLAETTGKPVIGVELRGVLHLKTGVTALDDDTLLASGGAVDLSAFDGFEVLFAAEPNVLRLPDRLLVQPECAALLRARGYPIDVVDISELAKAEAGLTCLSVVLCGSRGSYFQAKTR